MSRAVDIAAGFRASGVGRWFYGRELTEQRIIALLAGFIALCLLWIVFWKPVSDWRDIELNRHTNAQNLVEWLHANQEAAKKAGDAQGAQVGGRALIPVITKAAQAHSLRVNRLQPESNGVISVVLEQQPFNKIISWISQLDENNGVSVDRASFDSQDAPGYVNAQIRLN